MTDARAGRAALRGIQERWERAGAVPRDSADRLEGGLRKIEESLRKAEDSHWRRSNPEALSRARSTVDQIRAAIRQLENQLAKAQASGRRPGPAARPGGPGRPPVLARRGRAHPGGILELAQGDHPWNPRPEASRPGPPGISS